MKTVINKLSDALDSSNESTHLITTIGVVLLVLTFISASMYVLITSAA